MGLGITPSREAKGWTMQRFPLASTCSAKKGSLVMLDGARNVAEYISTSSHYLGVITHDSVNSLPAGFCTVAVPGVEARAMIDVPTGIGASATSLGQAYGITRFGTDPQPCSFLTTLATSVFSRVVTITAPVVVSPVSRVEVAFVRNEALFGSNSSVSIV